MWVIDCCPRCGSREAKKCGVQSKTGAQKYLCKNCGRYYQKERKKYSLEFKMDAIRQYLRGGSGIRAIADIKGVHNSLISYWIKNYAKIVKEIVSEIPEDINEIKAVEMDEMFLHVKKKSSEGGIFYGFVLTKDRVEFWTLK